MLLPTRAAGRHTRRLAAAPALVFTLAFTGLAAPAQNYGQQQPYPDPSAQQGYGNVQQDYGNAQQGAGDAQQDPPSRVARLSVAQGNVSVQPASVQDFAPAEVNYPLTTGDRVWSDAGAVAELQTGQVALRLGQQTDFTITGLTDTLAQFGLAQGSVHLRTFAMDPNTTTELDTPNAAVTVLAPGDLRVDVYPANDVTIFTLLSGAAQVDAQGFSQQLRPGESLQLSGSNPVYAQNVRRAAPDGFDGFSAGQDSSYQSALASEGSFVNDGTIGAADLGNYGDWNPDPDYGPVWFPRNVAFGWQPYRVGHWAWVAPWGWTWIEAEPWGFAPFHYGRWAQFRGRWGWIPGPQFVRPVYSPALVVFVGGPEFSAGLGFGGGAGVTAWFPLGPREPYQPWYHASDRYLTRVNVTNIYSRNQTEVRNIYAGRGPSPFRPDPNRQYVNRSLATVAVPQGTFAGGRPVANAALRVDPGRFADAPVLPHPLVSPTRTIVAPGPARALPPQMERPALTNRGGEPGAQRGPDSGFRGGNQPGSDSGYRGGNQAGYPAGLQPAPVSRPPANNTQAPGTAQPPRAMQPQPSGSQPSQPSSPVPHAPVERSPLTQNGPVQIQPAPGNRAPVNPSPVKPSPQQPTAPAQGNPPRGFGPGQQGQLNQPSSPVQRPLFNRAEPPQPRPSFDQQRQEMERTDPGRPLAPQQLNNLQQNRPAGPPPQREAIPHPTPQPQGQPQPNRQPPPPPQQQNDRKPR